MPKKANLVDGRYEIPSALFSFVHPVDDKNAIWMTTDHPFLCTAGATNHHSLFSSLLAPPLSRKYYSVQ